MNRVQDGIQAESRGVKLRLLDRHFEERPFELGLRNDALPHEIHFGFFSNENRSLCEVTALGFTG